RSPGSGVGAAGQRRPGRGGRIARRPPLPAAGTGTRAALRVDLRRVPALPRRLRLSGRTEDRVRAAGPSAAAAGEPLFLPAASVGSSVVRGAGLWAGPQHGAADVGARAIGGPPGAHEPGD